MQRLYQLQGKPALPFLPCTSQTLTAWKTPRAAFSLHFFFPSGIQTHPDWTWIRKETINSSKWLTPFGQPHPSLPPSPTCAAPGSYGGISRRRGSPPAPPPPAPSPSGTAGPSPPGTAGPAARAGAARRGSAARPPTPSPAPEAPPWRRRRSRSARSSAPPAPGAAPFRSVPLPNERERRTLRMSFYWGKLKLQWGKARGGRELQASSHGSGKPSYVTETSTAQQWAFGKLKIQRGPYAGVTKR